MLVPNPVPYLPEARIQLGSRLVRIWELRGRSRQQRRPVLLDPKFLPSGPDDLAGIDRLAFLLSRHAGLTYQPGSLDHDALEVFASPEALAHQDGLVAAIALAVAGRWRAGLGITEADEAAERAMATVTGCYLGFAVLLANGTLLPPPGARPLQLIKLWRPELPLPENDPPGGRRVQVGFVPASIVAYFLAVIVNCAGHRLEVRGAIFDRLRSPQREFYLASLHWLLLHRPSVQFEVEELESAEDPLGTESSIAILALEEKLGVPRGWLETLGRAA